MQGYATKYEFLNTFYWIKQIYPLVFFSSFVYVAILFLNLCGVYKLENSNPIIILGYLSLIHFFSYPLFQLGLNGNAICLLIFPYINLIWIVAAVVGHFVMFVAFLDRATLINEEVPIHYHFAAAYFINSLVLEFLLIFFKTQEMKKLKVALETQESEEGRIDRYADKYAEKYVEKFGNKNGGPAENAFHTISMGNQPNEAIREANAVVQAIPVITPFKETKEDTNPFSEKRQTIERKHSEGKATIRKIEFDRFSKSSNKEQATNLIETQNSIRNILNKRTDLKK